MWQGQLKLDNRTQRVEGSYGRTQGVSEPKIYYNKTHINSTICSRTSHLRSNISDASFALNSKTKLGSWKNVMKTCREIRFMTITCLSAKMSAQDLFYYRYLLHRWSTHKTHISCTQNICLSGAWAEILFWKLWLIAFNKEKWIWKSHLKLLFSE